MQNNNTRNNTLHTKRCFSLFAFRSSLCRGFTLVETVVALGLFITVILVGVGSLTNMSAATQRTKAIVLVVDNLNFALDSMARSIRTGTHYHCGGGILTDPVDCSGGTSQIAFRDTLGRTVVYRLANGAIQRSTDGALNFLDMTSPNITIEILDFFVEGAPGGDGRQPRALLIVRGTAQVGKDIQTFNIQTLVTQRIFDS